MKRHFLMFLFLLKSFLAGAVLVPGCLASAGPKRWRVCVITQFQTLSMANSSSSSSSSSLSSSLSVVYNFFFSRACVDQCDTIFLDWFRFSKGRQLIRVCIKGVPLYVYEFFVLTYDLRKQIKLLYFYLSWISYNAKIQYEMKI